MTKIAVIDYAKGNLQSVQRGLEFVGGEAFVTVDPEEIRSAGAVVLPGVGAFADASDSMQQAGQLEATRAAIEAGLPFLGICLGMHLLFENGTEGSADEHDHFSDDNAPGLGVLPGTVGRMPTQSEGGAVFKVPHVGWNTVDFTPSMDTPIMAGIDSGEYFYFTHSFVSPASPYTQATTTHSIEFPCVVDWNKTAFGVQFHPEKSSDAGMAVLKNFVELVNS